MLDTNKIVLTALLVVLVVSLCSPAWGASNNPEPPCSGKVKTGTYNLVGNVTEVKYTMGFNETTNTVCVNERNIGGEKSFFSVSILVDGRAMVSDIDRTLLPGESETFRANITSWLNATADEHWVSTTTYGPEFTFNFTDKINASSEDGVPTPYIQQVKTVQDGNSGSRLLKVLVKNPADRLYGPNVYVKTSETSGTRALGNSSDGDVIGYTIHLNEGDNETVVGSANLYFNEGVEGGGFDKKAFVIPPNGSIEMWDKNIGDVVTMRDLKTSGDYYQNASALKYRGEGPKANPEARQKGRLAAGGVAVALALLVGFRYLR